MTPTNPISPAIRRLILTISVSVITVLGAGYGARLASGDNKTEVCGSESIDVVVIF